MPPDQVGILNISSQTCTSPPRKQQRNATAVDLSRTPQAKSNDSLGMLASVSTDMQPFLAENMKLQAQVRSMHTTLALKEHMLREADRKHADLLEHERQKYKKMLHEAEKKHNDLLVQEQKKYHDLLVQEKSESEEKLDKLSKELEGYMFAALKTTTNRNAVRESPTETEAMQQLRNENMELKDQLAIKEMDMHYCQSKLAFYESKVRSYESKVRS